MKGSCAVIGNGMKTTANDSREEDGMSEITILIAALAFGLLAYVRIASHSRGFSVLIVLLLAAAAIVCRQPLLALLAALLAVLGYVAGAVEKT